MYEELCSKIRDQIRTITHDSDNYDKKYMKIKFNSDDDFLLNKTFEIHNITIVIRAVFHENNKCYPQFFLDKCLYKLWIIQKSYIMIGFRRNWS